MEVSQNQGHLPGGVPVMRTNVVWGQYFGATLFRETTI